MLPTSLSPVLELLWLTLDTHTPLSLTANTSRDLPMPSPRLMLLTSVMATLMLTLVSHSDLALVWTLSLRDWILPLRAMFLTTDTDIMPTVIIMERGPLRLRLTQRLTPP